MIYSLVSSIILYEIIFTIILFTVTVPNTKVYIFDRREFWRARIKANVDKCRFPIRDIKFFVEVSKK